MKLVVVSAGHAPASGTSRLGRLIAQEVGRQREGTRVEYIELRTIAAETVTALITGQAGTPVRQAIDRVRGAEGLVLLTSMAFAIGVVRLGKRKCLVQELPAVE